MAVVADPAPERARDGSWDVAQLFADNAATVHRLVGCTVRAPDPLIEDACQMAWSRLLDRRRSIRRECAVAWLVRTGIREALRLIRSDRRTIPLAALADENGDWELPSQAPALEEVVAVRARLAGLRALPERQQRLLWLQAAGFSYVEMAERTGTTARTVERQILRARRRLARPDAPAALSGEPAPACAGAAPPG